MNNSNNFIIKDLGSSTYEVKGPEEKYKVSISQDLFESNTCTCKDVDCVHIKAVIDCIAKSNDKSLLKENIIYLDVETQLAANEVGGWGNIDKMKVAIVVIYSSRDEKFEHYREDEMTELVKKLEEADLIVGFNIKRFDYTVIQPYVSLNLSSLPTLDMLQVLHKKLGHRVSLDSLAQGTLNSAKSADGLQSLEWFRNGELQKVIDYCIQDVRVTRDVFLYGRKHGKVRYVNKRFNNVKTVNVDW